jgi:hypothetical protein
MLQKGSGHQAFVQRQPDATWPPEQEVSLRLFDGQYSQTASAPNFQGGVITLCTCKHWMRTFKPAKWRLGCRF